MHKFELYQYSRRTEITVYIKDKVKLVNALADLGIITSTQRKDYSEFISNEFDDEFRVRTRDRLLKYQCDFCKGRIIPKPPKNKPKSKKKPKFDYNIIVGLSPKGELIYKKL